MPIDTVNRVVPQLIAAGKYVRPALGVEVDERLNQLIAQRNDVTGVVILRMTPGSSAEAAGLSERGRRHVLPAPDLYRVLDMSMVQESCL